MKTTHTLITLLATVALAGTTAWAQGPGPGPGGPGHGPGGPGGPGGFGERPMMGQQDQQPPGPPNDPVQENLFPPELIMRHQTEIGLTDDQKKVIREELLEAQTQFTKLQWEMQDAHQALAELVKEDKIDEAGAVAQLDKLLAKETELKRLQLTLAIRLKNQLTSEQIKQLQELKPDRARGGARPMRGQGR